MALTGREVQLEAYLREEVRTDDFSIVEVPVRDLDPGEVLVRNTWTSVDPGLRLRLTETGPAGYFAAFPLRAAMDGIMTVGNVVASRAEGFAVGDTVWHASGWRDYAVVDASKPALSGLGNLTRLDTDLAALQSYLGPLGGMGLTAYAGLFEVAGLREGDVVWISAAAGAVGSLAAQFAKIRGHRVIGSAGSNEKVSYLLDELGLDAAFNYRATPVAEAIADAAPDGIDVYSDNVGGNHLEAALGALRRWGRGHCAVRSLSTSAADRSRDRRTSFKRPPTTSPSAAFAAAATFTSWRTCSERWGAGFGMGRSATASRSPMDSSVRLRRWSTCCQAPRSGSIVCMVLSAQPGSDSLSH